MTPGRTGRPAPRVPFEAVVAEHGPTVMRVCRAILDPVDADDAWVDTFVSAMRAYPDLAPGSNVRGWLVTIAHNRAIDVARAARRRPVPTAAITEEPVVTAQDTATPADGALRAALDALGDKQRAAVVHRHLADLPYPEIARPMDISEAAARRNASDGIANLRTQLEGARS